MASLIEEFTARIGVHPRGQLIQVSETEDDDPLISLDGSRRILLRALETVEFARDLVRPILPAPVVVFASRTDLLRDHDGRTLVAVGARCCTRTHAS
jgi:hypothetical protein